MATTQLDASVSLLSSLGFSFRTKVYFLRDSNSTSVFSDQFLLWLMKLSVGRNLE